MSDWKSALDDANHRRGEFAYPDPEGLDCEQLQTHLGYLNQASDLWNQRRTEGSSKAQANAGGVFAIVRQTIEHYLAVIDRDCHDVPELQGGGDTGSGPVNTDDPRTLVEDPPTKANDIVNSPDNETLAPKPTTQGKKSVKDFMPHALIGLAAVCVIIYFVKR